jgi:AP-1 complex subunit mu
VNILVGSNGNILRSEILGALKMRSYLSGMPELKLGLNDKLLFESTGRTPGKGKSVEMEDIKFHQCVRLARFENDRTISFIPPDGEFDLMSYRLSSQVSPAPPRPARDPAPPADARRAGQVRPLIWIEAVVEPYSGSRIEYMIKAKSQFKQRSVANNVEVCIPVPPDADSPSFKAGTGSARYAPEKDCIIWTIKQFPGQKEYFLRAHFGLPSVTSDAQLPKIPISVKFEIPYFTVSGIQVLRPAPACPPAPPPAPARRPPPRLNCRLPRAGAVPKDHGEVGLPGAPVGALPPPPRNRGARACAARAA